MPQQNEPLLQVRSMTISSGKRFYIRDVSFGVFEGFSMAIMGEKGSGRTTIARAIIGEAQLSTGEVITDDKSVQYIPTNAGASFNPSMNALEVIADPLLVNNIASKTKVSKKVKQLFKVVSLDIELLEKYHIKFNETEKIKLALARSLAMRPELIILDEPLKNIEKPQKQQIINILDSIKRRFSTTLLIITNDIQAIRHLCNRVGILCAGRLVEFGSTDAVFGSVKHPYTESLIFNAAGQEKYGLNQPPVLSGEPDTIRNAPLGCLFIKDVDM